MLRLMIVVASIGLADSLNPTTIAPALYIATGDEPRKQILEFTVAVFLVYLIGGLIIDFGPGHLLLALVPHPRGGRRRGIADGSRICMGIPRPALRAPHAEAESDRSLECVARRDHNRS
jgi:hypothetical protein